MVCILGNNAEQYLNQGFEQFCCFIVTQTRSESVGKIAFSFSATEPKKNDISFLLSAHSEFDVERRPEQSMRTSQLAELALAG